MIDLLNNYTAFFSAMFGAIIGGFLSWLTVRYNLNRQFSENRKIQEYQERKQLLLALNSVGKEIEYNLIQLSAIRKNMVAEGMDFIDYKASKMHNNLKMDKWEKHSDTIEIENIPFLGQLQAFYVNLSFEINNQANSRERTDKQIDMGLELSKKLKSLKTDLEIEVLRLHNKKEI